MVDPSIFGLARLASQSVHLNGAAIESGSKLFLLLWHFEKLLTLAMFRIRYHRGATLVEQNGDTLEVKAGLQTPPQLAPSKCVILSITKHAFKTE